MVKDGEGSILLTGATAGVRGGNGFSGFAMGKFGLRALGQSLAREFHPQVRGAAPKTDLNKLRILWRVEKFLNFFKP